MYKEENKYQEFMNLKKIHKYRRMPKIATLQKRKKAIFLNVPPKLKGEKSHKKTSQKGWKLSD